MSKQMILAGDIGGTKTNLAVFVEGEARRPLAQAAFASQDYDSLESMAADFLRQTGCSVQRAAFGVAGPVLEGRAKITKLSWLVDGEALHEALRLTAPALVVNDLVATAHGLAALAESEFVTLNEGRPVARGPLAIIAPGTGLGEAMMFWTGERYQAQATEGGHALFSPADRRQLALADFLFAEHGAVPFDLLASGRGLPLIYAFVKGEGNQVEPEWLRAALLAEGADPAPLISRAALDRNDPLCLASLRLFVELLAVEARNLALKSLCTGGLFIGGGIPPRLPQVFAEVFMPAFIGRGPMRDILARLPVRLIMNPETALIGAARLGLGLT